MLKKIIMANPCSDIETFIAALEKRRDQLIDILTARQPEGGRIDALRRQIKELQAQILQEMILLQKCRKKTPAPAAAAATDPIPSFTLKVHIINIHYNGPDNYDRLINKTTPLIDIFNTLDHIQKSYSISHINITGIETIGWNRQLKFDENRDTLLEFISSLRSISGSSALYIGILPEEAGYSGTCSMYNIETGVCLLSENPATVINGIAPVMDQKEMFSDSVSGQLPGEKKQTEYYHLSFHRDHLQHLVSLVSGFHLYQEEPVVPAHKLGGIRAYFYSNENVLMYSGYTNAGDAKPVEKLTSAFQLSFPRMENMQRIQLVENNFSIGEFYIAPSAPQVYITGIDFREEGENRFLHVTWEGSAADFVQPSLVYSVRFSTDGLQWHPLLVNINTTWCNIDLDQLPGGSACRIQVLASAGLRTSIAETYHFILPVKPRKVYWMHPVPQSVYAAGQPLYCAATAYSPNFNNALQEEITWTSLKHGYLGTGQQLLVTHLTPGKDWIQVHMPDGLGNLLTKQVEISIV